MSAAPVFSAASIAGCIFTVLVSIALPVAALAVLKRKTGRGLLAALVGAGCFIGYALVLEQLLHAAVFSCFRLLRCIRRPIRLTAALPRACLRKQAA